MKKFNKIFGMTAVAAATFSLASCQNELDGYVPGGNTGANGVSLVRTPDVIAWSGQQLIGNTIVPTTRTNQDAPYWNGTEEVKPNDITPAERDKVVKWFEENPGDEDGVEWPDFRNYYVQQLWYSDVLHEDMNGKTYTSKECVVQIEAITTNSWTDNVFGGDDNFNDCRYIYGVTTTGFKYNNSVAGWWSTKYKIAYIDGYYYIGFDVEAKPAGDQDANKNQHFKNDPDGRYDDRIIKIVPADANGNIIPSGGNNEGGDEGDGGNTGDDNNDDVTETPENPGTPNNPGNGNVTNRHGDEVEVNYAILDSHQQYNLADLVTKLSIHVRKATDVKIEIPIPARYLVDSDDLFIFNDHSNFVYNEQLHRVTYNVGGNEVSLTVTIDNDAIIVETEGITQDVIDYCWETNQDGINFEVFNYFQSEDALWNPDDTEADTIAEANRKALFAAMNEAKIEFLDEDYVPNYYINAFGADITNNQKHKWHAIVTPPLNKFDRKIEQTTHLNGTSFNDIYVKAGAPIDVTHRH